jgi:hypothetical protein
VTIVGDRLLVAVRGAITLAAQLRDLARLPVQKGPQLRQTGGSDGGRPMRRGGGVVGSLAVLVGMMGCVLPRLGRAGVSTALPGRIALLALSQQ